MADRIQARAIRRCGELLKQIEPAHGTRTDLEHQEGAHPKLTRESAATEAGLSEHQRKQSLRVANVPEAERRLGELIRAQKETVGLNRGAKGSQVSGSKREPVKDERPTLAEAGIDKKPHRGAGRGLREQARRLSGFVS